MATKTDVQPKSTELQSSQRLKGLLLATGALQALILANCKAFVTTKKAASKPESEGSSGDFVRFLCRLQISSGKMVEVALKVAMACEASASHFGLVRRHAPWKNQLNVFKPDHVGSVADRRCCLLAVGSWYRFLDLGSRRHGVPRKKWVWATCPLQGCSGAVQRVLSKMEGVQSVDIDLKEQKVVVKGDVDPQKVLETVAKTGKATSLWQ
jgi:copper chaperone CopZ